MLMADEELADQKSKKEKAKQNQGQGIVVEKALHANPQTNSTDVFRYRQQNGCLLIDRDAYARIGLCRPWTNYQQGECRRIHRVR
jgi:hypothetical protein